MSTETYWMVKCLQRWEDIQLTSSLLGIHTSICSPDDPNYPQRFIPVFTTKEGAEAYAGGKWEIIRLTVEESQP